MDQKFGEFNLRKKKQILKKCEKSKTMDYTHFIYRVLELEKEDRNLIYRILELIKEGRDKWDEEESKNNNNEIYFQDEIEYLVPYINKQLSCTEEVMQDEKHQNQEEKEKEDEKKNSIPFMIENVSTLNEFKTDPKCSLLYFNLNCFLEILKNQIVVTEEKICETMIQCSKIITKIIELISHASDLKFLKKRKKRKQEQQEIENESQIRINKKSKNSITKKKEKKENKKIVSESEIEKKKKRHCQDSNRSYRIKRFRIKLFKKDNEKHLLELLSKESEENKEVFHAHLIRIYKLFYPNCLEKDENLLKRKYTSLEMFNRKKQNTKKQ